ncbi:TetR/AcrR family transcriptional regulator [Mycoplasmatota bacterium]|nr:TetR/AcrR family transcriptional regulator [Mycoplasmatota bacterium]
MIMKEIQKQRVKNYFIQATKDIISDFGISQVTVRKVGERAGYSYATIYNYFSDLNSLLTCTGLSYLDDSYEYIVQFKDDNLDPKKQIVKLAHEYFKFMTMRPDVYRIIYILDYGERPKQLIRTNVPKVALLLNDTLKKIKSSYVQENIEIISNILSSSIHAKIMFYIGKRDDFTLEDWLEDIENEIEFLLGSD